MIPNKLFALLLAAFCTLMSGNIHSAPEILRMATTTSTDNSGLLKALIPPFEQETGIQVHIIAVGTGKALKLGERGDVDILLVHARKAEEAFIEAGFGVERHAIMYNDFIIIGPENDPAGIHGLQNAGTAFRRIATSNSLFVSRGDNSGTHKKEMAIWSEAGITPKGNWYREVGQGMGKTLQIAGELGAYTLTDRGTWLAFRNNIPLTLLMENDSHLINYYGAIAINPKRFPATHIQAAEKLIAWLTSDRGRKIIQAFRIDGEQLFYPVKQ